MNKQPIPTVVIPPLRQLHFQRVIAYNAKDIGLTCNYCGKGINPSLPSLLARFMPIPGSTEVVELTICSGHCRENFITHQYCRDYVMTIVDKLVEKKGFIQPTSLN